MELALGSWPRRGDLLVAAAVAAVAQVETWTTAGYEPRAAYALAAAAMTFPLAWRRVAPVAVLAIVFVPLIAMAAAGQPLDSTYVMVVLLVAFHAAGAYCERRRAIIALAIGLGLLTAVLLIEPDGESTAGDLVFLGAILSVVWALAVGIRERAAQAGALKVRAQALELERDVRAREAAAEERARIARELHDLVAHSISVIAVQTGTLRRRLSRDRPDDAEELALVERTARETLAEMRRLLGLLRTDDEAPALSPQPDLSQVERLAEQVRRAGLDVDLTVEGGPRPLPPGIDLAAYRIVQEALTNAIKHAGPARARVTVRYLPGELELEITDDGAGPRGNGDGSGHGLVGMRERVALYGGSLDAGPGGERGFAVRARLPIAARR